MAKVSIVNVGMHGHVNPTLGFTEALVRQGHTVTYYATAPFSRQIAQTGARFVAYPSQMGGHAAAQAQAQTATGAQPWRGRDAINGVVVDEFSHTLAVLLGDFAADRPDVVVYNFISLAGRVAAAQLGIPAVKFFTTYAINEHYDLMASFDNENATSNPATYAVDQQQLDGICHRFGLATVELASVFSHAEVSNLVFLPRSLQPQQETFSDAYAFVGPCLRERDTVSEPALVPPGEAPLVVVSLGSVFHGWTDFYRQCLLAFGNSDQWRVVMGIGPDLDPASLGPVPSHIRLARHLPQLELLQQAAVFVTHGGMNSTMEALYYGVPTVMIPQMAEQELTARQIAARGLGIHLARAEVSAASLLTAVTTVHGDAQYQKQVAAMRAEVRAAGGTTRAVAVIETATERKPPLPPLPTAIKVSDARLDELNIAEYSSIGH